MVSHDRCCYYTLTTDRMEVAWVTTGLATKTRGFRLPSATNRRPSVDQSKFGHLSLKLDNKNNFIQFYEMHSTQLNNLLVL
jgi:hypothetical protein